MHAAVDCQMRTERCRQSIVSRYLWMGSEGMEPACTCHVLQISFAGQLNVTRIGCFDREATTVSSCPYYMVAPFRSNFQARSGGLLAFVFFLSATVCAILPYLLSCQTKGVTRPSIPHHSESWNTMHNPDTWRARSSMHGAGRSTRREGKTKCLHCTAYASVCT